MMKVSVRMWAGAVALGVAVPAQSHMPYLSPAAFDAGGRSTLVLEASFTEDAFRPEIAMDDAPFELTGPDGLTRRLAPATRLADRTIASAELPAGGIYRLSSGQRLGRMNRMIRKGDVWSVLPESATPSAGAAIHQVRSTTLADAYVLRGKPGSQAALKPRGTALELHPLADPTALGGGEPFALEVLFDGKPLAGAAVSLFRERGLYDGRKVAGEAVSGADGRVTVPPPDPGRYLLLVRHRAATPGGATAPFYSYTVTLAFEAS